MRRDGVFRPERPRNAPTGVSVKKIARPRRLPAVGFPLLDWLRVLAVPAVSRLSERLSACGRESLVWSGTFRPRGPRYCLARFSFLKKKEKPSPQETVGRYPRRLCVPDLFAETRDRCCARAKTQLAADEATTATPKILSYYY